MNYLLLPSLLSADFTNLGEEVDKVFKAGADMIHLDVMDGHYVPNLTVGPAVCTSLRRRFPSLPIDVHLMTNPVDAFIMDFAKAGATRISIHPDASIHLDRSLKLIADLGCQVGLALNPGSSTDILPWIKHRLDFILVMTVNPGFAGQSLIPQTLEKVKTIHKDFPQIPICVDGGISVETIADAARAGASQFVAGHAIFATSDYNQSIAALRNQLATL